ALVSYSVKSPCCRIGTRLNGCSARWVAEPISGSRSRNVYGTCLWVSTSRAIWTKVLRGNPSTTTSGMTSNSRGIRICGRRWRPLSLTRGSDEDSDAFHLPRRYLDPRWREHRRACCRRRGLRTCNRHVPRHLRTLARHTHHLAARRQGDRGQPPSARGVESIKSTTFREVKKVPTSLYLGSKSPHW